MEAFDFALPGAGIVFGFGKLAEVGTKAAALGKKAMLVSDPFCVQNGLAEKVTACLSQSEVESVVYDGVIPNPTTTAIDKGAELATAEGCDLVIGLGGGSAMDTAKAIAVGAVHEGGIWAYAMGEAVITNATLPIIAITTTSGTGSQCTCFSVITNPETNQKPGMGSPYILPSVAIVDPELMLCAPAGLTFNTGFDVFAHAIEAYTSKAASPLSDLFAEKAISLFAANFKAVIKDGSDREARAGMALADTCAGIAICHAVVSVGHVIAHVLGGHFHDLPHGEALFCIYPQVLAHNAQGESEKHAWAAGQLVPGCESVTQAFKQYFAEFQEVKALKERGMDGTKVRELAEDTFTYLAFATELNPVEVNADQVEAMLTEAIA
ncbi:MAG: iron-containing alcohol dehydrogenase [Planctomycetota bacterium]|jgi:alcohol dehydrogenase class IV